MKCTLPWFSKLIQSDENCSRIINRRGRADPGCTYLQFNRRNGVSKDEHWARYLTDKLNALNLFRLLPEEKIIELGVLPAHGLKPGWYHLSAAAQRTLPPESKELTIAYHAQHPMFPTDANAIKQLLSQDGITVNVINYEHTVVETENGDIWIKPMGKANHRDDALAVVTQLLRY